MLRCLFPSASLLTLLLSVVSFLLSASSQAAPLGERLINLSTRAYAGEGSDSLIVGFVIDGDSPKSVLVRAAGPALRDFGVARPIENPQLRLYDRDGKLVASNDDWEASDAVVFADVGAFALPTSSRDSALRATLAPGLYSAVVSGGSGVGMVEVYDVSGFARLVNVSTRARAGSGDETMIAGLVNAGTGKRRVLLRAVGPGLAKFSVTGVLGDPVLSLRNSQGAEVLANDNWEDTASDIVAAAGAQAGAFALERTSADAALVTELDPGAYTVLVQSKDGMKGIVLLEAYDLTPLHGTIVTVAAAPAATAPGSSPAYFVFSRSGKTEEALTLSYTISGSAVPNVDFHPLSGTITFPTGQSEVSVPVSVVLGTSGSAVTVSIEVQPVPEYQLAVPRAMVTLHREPGTIYLSDLRPPVNASTTGAHGSAVIQLTADERYLWLSLNFSNLSSAETHAYLRMTGTDGQVYSLRLLPRGQIGEFSWDITGTAGFSASEVVAALKAGRVFVELATESMPGGELTGTFARSTGSRIFSPPSEPPSLPIQTPTEAQASRFLMQSTFGPRKQDIDDVRARGFAAWLDTQFAVQASSHRTATTSDFAANPPSASSKAPGGGNRQAAWWKTVVKGEDQLRQRVAFALSELFVVSDVNSTLSGQQEALAAYWDILGENAFGDFRTLLEKVSLSPVMGVYLSSLRNAKANPSRGTVPDENFAREIMQLFTIGLWQLQPDGTLKLGVDGRPVATYTQATIGEMARVFTGWAFQSAAANPSFRGAPADFFSPMMLYPSFHDNEAKTIVSGVTLPAGQGGAADLRDTLDALVQHPNTGPFIAKFLIQRLVTSNPSPAYVYRVAKVFADNGAGRRGDLRSVVRAVLLDYEARADAATSGISDGKLKEPLLRLTALLRAMDASHPSDRFAYNNPESALGQAALRSPTVFNFFEPTYRPPGLLADLGLIAPEYQILTSNTAITVPNTLYNYIYSSPNGVVLDWTALSALAAKPVELVDRVNVLFCAGTLSPAHRDRLVAALGALPKNTSDVDRAKLVVYLVATTASGAVQH
ncbi:MAG: DUF1800 family protein [Opitutaceae bacterium]|nr:DUF1800 family protein [Opitutaceae bacterium]